MLLTPSICNYRHEAMSYSLVEPQQRAASTARRCCAPSRRARFQPAGTNRANGASRRFCSARCRVAAHRA